MICAMYRIVCDPVECARLSCGEAGPGSKYLPLVTVTACNWTPLPILVVVLLLENEPDARALPKAKPNGRHPQRAGRAGTR